MGPGSGRSGLVAALEAHIQTKLEANNELPSDEGAGTNLRVKPELAAAVLLS